MGCPDDALFLDMLEGGLDEALSGELHEHIDRCEACAALVVDLAALCFPDDDPAPVEVPRMGRFELRRIVGAGGMGVVYEAWDADLQRRVALKVLRTDLIAPELREDCARRLKREAQLMAALSHPNVLPVYEVGEDQEMVFVAMEYVEGCALDVWMREREGSDEWHEALGLFVEAGRGLAAAHQAGLVHRDVKPGNILLSDAGRVFITDFGLGRVVGAQQDDALRQAAVSAPSRADALLGMTSITQTGAVLGTPAYMSPEQHLGAEAGPASDQFSFCVALFEALTGARPFQGRSREELARRVCGGHITPPPGAASLPEHLSTTLERGMAPAPEDRWPDMRALLDALERPAPLPLPTPTPTRTSTLARPLLAAALLLGVLGAGGLIAQARTPSPTTPSPAPAQTTASTPPTAQTTTSPAPTGPPTPSATSPTLPTALAQRATHAAQEHAASTAQTSARTTTSAPRSGGRPATTARVGASRRPATSTTPTPPQPGASPPQRPRVTDAMIRASLTPEELAKRDDAARNQRFTVLVAQMAASRKRGDFAACRREVTEARALIKASPRAKLFKRAIDLEETYCLFAEGKCDAAAARYLEFHLSVGTPEDRARETTEGVRQQRCRAAK